MHTSALGRGHGIQHGYRPCAPLGNDVPPSLDRVEGVGELPTCHYQTAVAAEGMTTPSNDDGFEVQTYGIAKGCIFEANYLIEQLRQQCLPAVKGEVLPVYHGRYGWFDGKKGRARSSSTSACSTATTRPCSKCSRRRSSSCKRSSGARPR